jgi:hypothetical protein
MSAFSLATVSGAEGCLTLPLVDAQPANKAAATTDINPRKRILGAAAKSSFQISIRTSRNGCSNQRPTGR